MYETGTPVEITGVREKEIPKTAAMWRRSCIGEKGTIIDWVGKKGFSVLVPKIQLLNGVYVFGWEVWWKRLE